MNYNITKKITIRNQSNKSLVNPIGVVIHSTATPEATDENENAYFNNNNVGANAHAFVDYDSITQNVETSNQAWGAGPTANKKYLMIELCEFASAEKFKQTWLRGVWLTAHWLKNIVGTTVVNVNTVPSHSDVSSWWHETDHIDPIPYFNRHGKSMQDFRNDVAALLNGQAISVDTSTSYVSDSLKLQQTLNRLKFRDGRGNILQEDGVIGICTKEAVKRLQNICGLTIDGIAGPATWGVINSILSKPTLNVGSRGPVVRYLQHRVGVAYDGIFGANTKTYVVKWQSQFGCSQDGIVGPATWKTMIG